MLKTLATESIVLFSILVFLLNVVNLVEIVLLCDNPLFDKQPN